MSPRLFPTRTKEDLAEEVDIIVRLSMSEGGELRSAVAYLERLLSDEYESGFTAGQDSLVVGRLPEQRPVRRTRMPRDAA